MSVSQEFRPTAARGEKRWRRIVAAIAGGFFCLSAPVNAATTFVPASASNGAAYNLGSTQPSMVARNSHNVTINVGGTRQVVAGGAKLTPAEMVAVTEILNSGRQTLILGTQGNAVGGRL